MGNSPSTPGQPENPSSSSGKNSSTTTGKQSQQLTHLGVPAATGSASSTTIAATTNPTAGSTRGSHSNIPIQSAVRPTPAPYMPTTQHRPAQRAPLPPPPPPPPNQQSPQRRPVSQYIPLTSYQPSHNNNSNNQAQSQSRPPSGTRGRQISEQSTRFTASQSDAQPGDDEIPTIVLQEQMEAMLIEIATTESRVRELREELDTFQSHPIFKEMMVVWLVSLSPGDYSLQQLDKLKQNALTTWKPVLNTFIQDNSSGRKLSEIDVRLFDTIIQDVISHADMIAGSTMGPEELIQNLIQIAHSELENARKSLERNRNAFQECQLTLQARGVIPEAVLEMQRQMEEEQRKEQEAKRVKEQRQRELEQRLREEERIKDLELQRERARRLEELEEEQRRRDEARRINQEEVRKNQEEMLRMLEAKSGRLTSTSMAQSNSQATNHVIGRPKASSVSVPDAPPEYSASSYTKKGHTEPPMPFGISFAEEEIVVADQEPGATELGTSTETLDSNYLGKPVGYPPAVDDQEVPSTPLLRRPRPYAITPGENTVRMAVAPERFQYASHAHTDAPQHSEVQHLDHPTPYPPMPAPMVGQGLDPVHMPMPRPYIPDYNQHEYGSDQGHSQSAGQARELPRSMPKPELYPPQIITDQELNDRLRLEQLKKENEEMGRELLRGQERNRRHTMIIQNLELQGQGYSQFSSLGPPLATHGNTSDEYQHFQSQYPGHPEYTAYAHQQQQQQQQQQQHQEQHQEQQKIGFIPQFQHQHHQQQPGFPHHPSNQQLYQSYCSGYASDPNAPSFKGSVINGGQDQPLDQADYYTFQSYGGYSNQITSGAIANWQQQPGFVYQQQHPYHPSLSPAQQQQQYVLSLQQQQQQSPTYQHDGYVDGGPHQTHAHVAHTTSSYVNEDNFVPTISPSISLPTTTAAIAASPITPAATIATATMQLISTIPTPTSHDEPLPKISAKLTPTSPDKPLPKIPTKSASASLDEPLRENDASSADVLPQIRANPIKVPIRRAPHAILTEEQLKLAAAAAAAEVNEAEEQTVPAQDPPSTSTSTSTPALKVAAETPEQPSEDPVKEHEAPTNHGGDIGTGPTKWNQEQHHKAQQGATGYNKEDEEDEEETLQRSVGKIRITPRSTPIRTIPALIPKPNQAASSATASSLDSTATSVPSPSRSPAPTLSSNQQSVKRISQVFAPFPGQRPAPRVTPRPAPRPAIGGMAKASQGSLSVADQTVLDTTSSNGNSQTDSQGSDSHPPEPPSSSPPVQNTLLARSPSSPTSSYSSGSSRPAVPKKPLALRSPRSPTTEQTVATTVVAE